MNRPYTFLYDEPVREIFERLPDWCRFPFTGAKEIRHIRFDYAELLSQRLEREPFHIELFEMKCRKPFQMSYEVNENKYFLFFLLEGNLDFRSTDGFYISHVRSDFFGISFNRSGTFSIQMPTGRNTAVCVSMDKVWLEFVSEDMPGLGHIIKAAEKASSPGLVFPYCRMNLRIKTWLKSIYTELRGGAGAVDGLLRLYVSRTLQVYVDLMRIQIQGIPYRARTYLDEHYKDTDLAIGDIAAHFEISDRALRATYRREFGIGLQEYRTQLRMRDALEMITRGIPVSDVYMEVGYNDESTFRYNYSRFFRKK